MDKFLEAKAYRAAAAYSDPSGLFTTIVLAAARYWDGINADDFCIQHVGFECIVFGGTNRLLWTAVAGFWPDSSYCTESFLTRARELGPLPQARGR